MFQIVRLLLQSRASVGQSFTSEGKTAIHWAAWKGSLSALQLLLHNPDAVTAVSPHVNKAFNPPTPTPPPFPETPGSVR